MSDEPKNTNTTEDHVVLPVHTGDGNVDHVAFPKSTPLPVVHKALADHVEPEFDEKPESPAGKNYTAPGPHAPLNRNEQPSKSGVVENSPAFKKAASDVWNAAGRGRNTDEAGSSLDGNLKSTPVKSSNTDGKMRMQVPADATATIHSHPNHFQGAVAGGQPSEQDIATAKNLGKTVYVVSKNGLQSADKFGKVTNVYSNSDWMTKDNK
jgi:hypothetical protein